MFKHLAILSLGLLVGCSTFSNIGKPRETVYINDVEAPLSDVRSAVLAALRMGYRSISGNGREILSKHFLVNRRDNSIKPAGHALERYFVKILILGDRRPYSIEVLVAHEKRVLRGDSFRYVIDYYDHMLAKDIARIIEDELAKRREDRNIIDDFRVF